MRDNLKKISLTDIQRIVKNIHSDIISQEDLKKFQKLYTL